LIEARAGASYAAGAEGGIFNQERETMKGKKAVNMQQQRIGTVPGIQS
jgi:16S rRNA U1498 N3-methylase RsmE